MSADQNGHGPNYGRIVMFFGVGFLIGGIVALPLVPIGLLLLVVGWIIAATRKEQSVPRAPRTEGRIIDHTGQITGHPTHIHCPKCTSREYEAFKAGFSIGKAVVGGALVGPVGLLGGMIGANDVELACLRCGHRWKPQLRPH